MPTGQDNDALDRQPVTTKTIADIQADLERLRQDREVPESVKNMPMDAAARAADRIRADVRSDLDGIGEASDAPDWVGKATHDAVLIKAAVQREMAAGAAIDALNAKVAALEGEVEHTKRALARERAELLRIRERAAGYCWDVPGVDPETDTEAFVTIAIDRARAGDALRETINTPQVADFVAAMQNEAAHQRERWGVEHDAGKRVEDWVTLYTYLLGKLAVAHWANDQAKLLHHVITVGAVALNMHAALTGADTRMRPGIGPRDEETEDAVLVVIESTTGKPKDWKCGGCGRAMTTWAEMVVVDIGQRRHTECGGPVTLTTEAEIVKAIG